MKNELLNTRRAAELLNVTPSTIKRWSDEGILECVRTAGGHRRFRLEDLYQVQRRSAGESNSDHVLERWIALLASDRALEAIIGALMELRAEFGAWWRVADFLGDVLVEIGERWAKGTLSVLQEHMASERLHRAIAWCSQTMLLYRSAPRCLLVTAPGDEHTLGLALVELCLREMGWSALWVGRGTPDQDVVDTIESGQVELVALSASVFSQDPAPLQQQLASIRKAAETQNVPVVVGGNGVWPEDSASILRFRGFSGFHQFLEKNTALS